MCEGYLKKDLAALVLVKGWTKTDAKKATKEELCKVLGIKGVAKKIVKKTAAKKTATKKASVKKLTPKKASVKKVAPKKSAVKPKVSSTKPKVAIKKTPSPTKPKVTPKKSPLKPKPLKVKTSPVKQPTIAPPKYKTPSKVLKTSCIARSKLPLQEHQTFIVNHMRTHRGLIAALSVGSGKTLIAVTVSQCFLDDHPHGKVIIVTPASLQDNFRKEMLAYGANPDDPRYEYYTLQTFANHYVDKHCGSDTLLVIDEAHNLRTDIKTATRSAARRQKKSQIKAKAEGKTKRSKRSVVRADVAIRCAKTAGKVLLLTATSVYNKPHDISNLVAMVRGEEPLSKRKFENLLKKPSEFRQYFSCVISFYRVKHDASYPTVKEEYVEIPMSPAYYKAYHDVETKNSYLFDHLNPWQFLSGVRQASNALVECPKCDWVMKKIKDGKKTVIYSAFLSHGIRILQKEFDKQGIPYAEVTGELTRKQRDAAVQKYNANKVRVLFITKAGGEGLDLKETRNVIIFESSWNRPNEEQVIGRAARYQSHIKLPKKDQTVNVYHLMIVKPPRSKRGKGDDYESADTMLRVMIEEKEKANQTFINMLQPMSIENLKC